MITYRELLWLTHPEDVKDDAFDMPCPSHYRYDLTLWCPEVESCDECWDREIPYPVVAEAMIESVSVVNDYVAEKGTKLYVVEVDMKTQTNWNVRLSEEPKNEEGVWFNKKDFRFYIDEEEESETMKYKVGDKVRIRTWDDMAKEFGVNDNECINCKSVSFVSGMKKYCGKIMTIESVHKDSFGNVFCDMREDREGWQWADFMLIPAEHFSKDDLKDGMMIETAAHEKFLFIGKGFRSTSCQIPIDAYDSELKSCYDSKNDIIKVGYPDYEGCAGLTMLLQLDFGKVIWERHTKVITKEEAMDVLRKHYGENVVIAE